MVQSLEDRVLLAGVSRFLDPNAARGNEFGGNVTVLTNGNVVITAINDNAGGKEAGAVYLFNGETGDVISKVTGTHAGDHVGSGGVVALPNGNYVIISLDWNGGRGAVTYGNGTTGVRGTVNGVNSLIGDRAGDKIGSGGIKVLPNGSFVVSSPEWGDAFATRAGAITWVDKDFGVSGAVNVETSLTGSRSDDRLGSGGITVLKNGNYVIRSDDWDNGTIVDAGAVTFANGTQGLSGRVSSFNSLVGSHANDHVGSGGIIPFYNSNFLVRSPLWSNGTAVGAGAISFGTGVAGVKGTIKESNSLVGSTANDSIGKGAVTRLPGGDFILSNPSWSNGTAPAAGAVTFVDAAKFVTGEISATNSLVGSSANDRVGSGGVTVLDNGNFVIVSSNWNNGRITDAGAVTFGTPAAGVQGTISASNSLVGSSTNDRVGSQGVKQLKSGNFVIVSGRWNNGTAKRAGAVTFGSGTTGVRGEISAANSLIGTQTDDRVGIGNSGAIGVESQNVSGVVALPNGNYIVNSSAWNNGAALRAGAVTLGNGVKGIFGPVSVRNSLVGTETDQIVGISGVTVLANGNYVVSSPFWKTASFKGGAVTFGNAFTGVTGPVSVENSLVGRSYNDGVGYADITVLANGNYVVPTPFWTNGKSKDAGAVTFGNGTKGVKGVISPQNSLVGTREGDHVGGFRTGPYALFAVSGVVALANGNYAIRSPQWNGNRGAVTLGDGIIGSAGEVSAANSLVGSSPDDFIGVDGSKGIYPLSNGNFVVSSPYWDDVGKPDAGASTFIDGAKGLVGPISKANSLVGNSTNNRVGNPHGVVELKDGSYLIRTVSDSIAYSTYGSSHTGIRGVLTFQNSAFAFGPDASPTLVVDAERDRFYTAVSKEVTFGGIVYRGSASKGLLFEDPELSGPGVLNYVSGQSATAISPNLVIKETGTFPTLVSAVIKFDTYLADQDRLGFENTRDEVLGNIEGKFDQKTGELHLSSPGAKATVIQWQNALRSVTYKNVGANMNVAPRSISYTVSNGFRSNFPKLWATVGIGNPPLLATPGRGVYRVGRPPTVILPLIKVTDATQPKLASATVRIDNFVEGEDQLAFQNNDFAKFGSINAAFNRTTGVLYMYSGNASATMAQWQAALRAVTYVNSSNKPSLDLRKIRVQISDGTLYSNTVLSEVFVLTAPLLQNSGNLKYRKGEAAIPVTPQLALVYYPGAKLQSAKVRLRSFFANEDRLSFTNNDARKFGNITASYDAAKGILSLTSAGNSASLTQWKAVLQNVTYRNVSATPNATTRSYEVWVSETTLNSNTLTGQIAIGSNPVLENVSLLTYPYASMRRPLPINTELVVIDPDHPTLKSATVKITNPIQFDKLEFVNDNTTLFGDIESGSALDGALTMTSPSGKATLAQWQAALRNVTYTYSPLWGFGFEPNTTTRIVTFQVSSGILTSNLLTCRIAVGLPPNLIGTNKLLYPKGGQSELPLSPDMTVRYINGVDLKTATVTIRNYVPGEDELTLINVRSLGLEDFKASFNAQTGVFTLEGPAENRTVSQFLDWDNALQSIVYRNLKGTAGTFTTRLVSIQLSNGTLSGKEFKSQIEFSEAPALDNGSRLDVAPNQPATPINPGIVVTSMTKPSLSFATVQIFHHSAFDQLAFENTDNGIYGNIQANFNQTTGILKLTSEGATATVSQWQAALRAVTYTKLSKSPYKSPLPLPVRFQISDGQLKSNVITSSIRLL